MQSHNQCHANMLQVMIMFPKFQTIQMTNQRHRTSSRSCGSPPWSQPQSTQVGDTGQDSWLWDSGSQSPMESDTLDELRPQSQRSRIPHQLYLDQ